MDYFGQIFMIYQVWKKIWCQVIYVMCSYFLKHAYICLCTDTCRCMEHPIAPSFRNLLGWVLIMLLTGLDFRGWRAGWHFYMELFLAPKRLVFRVLLLSSWCFPPRYKERGRPGGRKTPPQWWRRGVAWGHTGVCRGRWAWVPAPRFWEPACTAQAPCSSLVFPLADWLCGLCSWYTLLAICWGSSC